MLYYLLFKMFSVVVEGHKGCANLMLDSFRYLKTCENKNGGIVYNVPLINNELYICVVINK